MAYPKQSPPRFASHMCPRRLMKYLLLRRIARPSPRACRPCPRQAGSHPSCRPVRGWPSPSQCEWEYSTPPYLRHGHGEKDGEPCRALACPGCLACPVVPCRALCVGGCICIHGMGCGTCGVDMGGATQPRSHGALGRARACARCDSWQPNQGERARVVGIPLGSWDPIGPIQI